MSNQSDLADLIRDKFVGVEPDSQDTVLEDSDWHLILTALTDHATATRQIAELRAQREWARDGWDAAIREGAENTRQIVEWSARALAAEAEHKAASAWAIKAQAQADDAKADAAMVREALEAILKVQVYGHDNIWAGSHRCKDIARQALATLTQRGA